MITTIYLSGIFSPFYVYAGYYLNKDYIKENSTVIDVGINADDEGNITGDVNTEDCIEKAAFITPVPAGVGSVTTAVLADHVVKACRLLNK